VLSVWPSHQATLLVGERRTVKKFDYILSRRGLSKVDSSSYRVKNCLKMLLSGKWSIRWNERDNDPSTNPAHPHGSGRRMKAKKVAAQQVVTYPVPYCSSKPTRSTLPRSLQKCPKKAPLL
jgi:hypothetical protein